MRMDCLLVHFGLHMMRHRDHRLGRSNFCRILRRKIQRHGRTSPANGPAMPCQKTACDRPRTVHRDQAPIVPVIMIGIGMNSGTGGNR